MMLKFSSRFLFIEENFSWVFFTCLVRKSNKIIRVNMFVAKLDKKQNTQTEKK